MADFSSIALGERATLTVDVPPYWADHHFLGRAVLPAVESMQLLAHWARRSRPDLNVVCMRDAAFDKFLELPSTGGRIEVLCEMQDLADGGLRAALLTRARSGASGMTRTKLHVRLDFCPPAELSPPIALDLVSALEGECFSVDPWLLYEELAPFGPAFQSICEPVRLTAEGALAVIKAPEVVDRQTDLILGSPFVLDGAFHAACAWSQRFAGVTAFPVRVDRRLVVAPTKPGVSYVSRIFPVHVESGVLTFDIWIVGADGRPFEVLEGVRMRDVSGGRVLPPDWVRSRNGAGLLDRIAGHAAAFVIIDRAALTPLADLCLTESEYRRTLHMGVKRRTDYLLARLACKRLSRRLSGEDRRTPPSEMETVAADGVRPMCPATDGRTYYCSVSHDQRFAVAVAGEQPLGVDVEALDDKALRNLRLFMNADEMEIVKIAKPGRIGAAVRAWTAKEAVAKMLNINLADAWGRTRALDIGVEQSHFQIDNGPAATVVHETLEDHLITLVHAV